MSVPSFFLQHCLPQTKKIIQESNSYLHTEKESNHILFTYVNNSFIWCRLYLTFGACQTESYLSVFI